MRDISYPPIIGTAKVMFRALGQRFQMVGTENVPRTGGALLVCNHVSYLDFIYGGLAANPSKRLVRFMAKKEIFDTPVGGPVMRSMHHIPVDRSAGESSLMAAVGRLRDGEVVGIFPEATISRTFELKEFKSGAVRIAAEADVPILPVIIWGTQRMFTKDHPRDFGRGKTIALTVGEAMRFDGREPEVQTAELKKVMAGLLDETIRRYPAEEQPPGSWWLPASYGGGAPTAQVAAELERVERERRLAKRRAQAAARRGD